MNNNKYAFILTSIAGITTLIGYLFIFIKKDREGIISKALGFASGVMLTISIIDLIPNALDLIIEYNIFIYSLIYVLMGFIIGIILSSVIDRKVDCSCYVSRYKYNIGLKLKLPI